MKEALLYQHDGSEVICGLCMHQCRIKPGRRGICGVRENSDGTLVSLVYGRISAEQIDPVEKKPLFHFLPSTLTYSISTIGCNFRCLHCQNHHLSQADTAESRWNSVLRSPEEVARTALSGGCRSISYTYVEPTVFFEFAYDCCLAANEVNLKNIFVSNGYMSRQAAGMLVPVLDAINIDIKSFTDDFYKNICGARLSHVLDNVRFFREQDVWVEVTTLLIPGLNDSDDEIRAIADFIVDVDPQIPWHISGFRPTYRMLDRPPTSPAQLQRARDIGIAAGVKYVYIGNVHDGRGESTICPGCGNTVIDRRGFMVAGNSMTGGSCPSCKTKIAGVW
ncbi:MAG: AmmeMemoRadiSam system radical SAM enzyme [Desulfocapsaceae bacterium]|jgi:pyruvate formate lyase activating enzyme|nr:AmmeMemoRadiSam system radical SAM enzyme [Desulfocapsaceae bacterium]